MDILSLKYIQNIQKELQDKHKEKWHALTPEYGRSCLLWMMEEFGEIVSVIKKCGENDIMNNATVRNAFIEEFVDVMMFMNDALLCYGISAEELSSAYIKKYHKNMGRNWNEEHANYLQEIK
ncbi:dATP/dGTP pyrophosphohydrolase domain-containing protein [Clostridium sp. ATCC 25772]|uniref:dATP/dGTP pyrophosphohydrolase domain-containing protein n=1 Tax=Clostridium sp. ATCC 25772 TaxID=1676991 RepID=UPI0007834F94|nr:dATP/dGTP pyrophosphohydrolase domain-containing protein [Clostridium sp. ATCC 25772]